MFDSIKIYLYAAVVAGIAIFISIFKYRGNKIANLEVELDSAEHNAVVVDKAMDSERKVMQYEADNREAAARVEAKDVEEIIGKSYSI